MQRKRAYLAGPEVFLQDAAKIGAQKREICAAHGLVGVFPSDKELDLAALAPTETGLAIYEENRALMDSCDLLIANMTPFRGPSMDVGTAFEMGYMRGLARPVFGYSNAAADYLCRVRGFFDGELSTASGVSLDPKGMAVEDFGLADNLMLAGVVREFADHVVCRDVPPGELYRNLEAFEACVALAAQRLAAAGGGRPGNG